jgi:cytochrome c oxidase cbb3-type subunit 2/cytochrome c oxidase cbb3-type subunit I/II
MPPYPWLFKGEAKLPTREGQDLLAYLKTLGRERQLAGAAIQALPYYCQCSTEMKRVETAPVGWTVTPAMARQSGPTMALPIPANIAEFATSTTRGSKLFAQNCASCHGASGKGDGVAAAALFPAPADLTIKHLSAERINFVMQNGVYGSAMPAWRDLKPADLQALICYVSTLGSEPASAMESPASTKELFNKNCSSCHGIAGDGKGPAAAALAPSPTNFRQVSPSMTRALAAISDGIPGTSMPPWKDQLSMGERGMLAAYVASLYSSNQSKEAH